MILRKLGEYYDRLAADPKEGISQEGFAPQKISFEVVIEEDGSLHAINDVRDDSSKKPLPQLMRLPYMKRTSGIKSMFLWDKAEYLLGWIPDELRNAKIEETDIETKKRLKKIERISDCFAATLELHTSFRDLKHKDFVALVKFLDGWKPEKLTADQQQLLENVGTGFGVFRVRNRKRFVHDVEEVRNFWIRTQRGSEDNQSFGTCLVTGKVSPLARLHPVLKGVAGCTIVRRFDRFI